MLMDTVYVVGAYSFQQNPVLLFQLVKSVIVTLISEIHYH
jgi:hypothetical protein